MAKAAATTKKRSSRSARLSSTVSPAAESAAAVLKIQATSASGQNVTPDTALAFGAVYAAVSIISRTSAMLPAWVYRREGEDARQRARNHPVSRLLHNPNPDMSAYKWRETMQAHVLTWGNGYSVIQRDGSGRPVALWPFHPSRVQVYRADAGPLVYVITDNTGRTFEAYSDDVLHVKALGDGLIGYSPVYLAKETLGAGIAAELFGAAFFANAARPSGALRYPKSLTEDQVKRVRAAFEAAQAGDNAHRIVVLANGAEWQPFTMPLDEAQFLESRKFSVTEIARWYGLPPHLIGDLDRATFSNIEEQGLEFVTYCLLPWLTNWEQELSRKLLSAAEQDGYFIEHSTDPLLRGNTQARYDAYQTAILNGLLNVDECRAKENLNPLPDGQGQVYYRPANVVPAGEDPEEPAPTIAGFAAGGAAGGAAGDPGSPDDKTADEGAQNE